MNSLKSLAMNCGLLSEIIRGDASGYFSFAPCKMISMSASLIDSRIASHFRCSVGLNLIKPKWATGLLWYGPVSGHFATRREAQDQQRRENFQRGDDIETSRGCTRHVFQPSHYART